MVEGTGKDAPVEDVAELGAENREAAGIGRARWALVRKQRGPGPRWDAEMRGVRCCHVADPFGNRIELIDGSP